ncbi:IS66-like element accessory protein TnpA [Azotobacter salinestris]|uniref:IS66-like element accessory protein TnpA n=1 Tax=Azotobacter salinestris TaxID=69964 RepID=UPI0012669611|nr:transposase [Azotobacter salinestris]
MQRRSYSTAFKAQVVQECGQPGASVASVALSHGINTTVVHQWIRTARSQVETLPAFIPLALDAPVRAGYASRADIRIDIPHRRTTLTVPWPAGDAEGCARFVREILQ